jgi:antitoxin component YwqK of YwqJK toxin-antitoxin module
MDAVIFEHLQDESFLKVTKVTPTFIPSKNTLKSCEKVYFSIDNVLSFSEYCPHIKNKEGLNMVFANGRLVLETTWDNGRKESSWCYCTNGISTHVFYSKGERIIKTTYHPGGKIKEITDFRVNCTRFF